MSVPESFELTTARLRLCLHDTSRARAVSEYYRRNAAHFAPYSARRDAEYHGIDAWHRRSGELRQTSLSGQALHLLLFRGHDASTVVGDVNVTNIVRGAFQAGHLGYELDRESVGQGLMHEALTAAIVHVFERLALHRLMANYLPTNERSGRLLRRLGFQVEGYARDYLLLDGKWEDHVLTSLTNQAFASSE